MPQARALPEQMESKLESVPASLLQLGVIAKAPLQRIPFPHLTATGLLQPQAAASIGLDFPQIRKPGFFPLRTLKRQGAFHDLLTELETRLAPVLTEKLGIELRDRPHLITIRKWSVEKDGRVHNDSESKIVTCLLYLNERWPANEDGGRFRVLNSDQSFDDAATEIAPDFGNFVAFVRTENSWHGHKPFIGERRVIQMSWLRSWEDLQRKEKQGQLSFFLKKFLPVS